MHILVGEIVQELEKTEQMEVRKKRMDDYKPV
jgi:hypothetical protein